MKVLFVTGAGVSANAGIPTYRDGGSSWKDKDLESKSHANRYGNHLEELWNKHWGPVSAKMEIAVPTHTHKAIADFQKNNEAIVATQNIDELHERAGSDNVAHIHGSMTKRCMKCRTTEGGFVYSGRGVPIHIPCGKKKVRLDVVLFGELLSSKLMKGLQRYAAREADYIVSVGTSLNVFPAAGLVMDNITKAIIINKEPTTFDKWAKAVYHSDCDDVIDEVLEGLDSTVQV